MNNFRYPLDRVLQWREVERRQAASRVESAQTVLARARDEHCTIQAALDRGPEPHPTGLDLGNWATWKNTLARHLKLAGQRVEAANTTLQQQQATLVEANRKVRLLEKLRSNELTRWRQDLEKETSALAAELHLIAIRAVR